MRRSRFNVAKALRDRAVGASDVLVPDVTQYLLCIVQPGEQASLQRKQSAEYQRGECGAQEHLQVVDEFEAAFKL